MFEATYINAKGIAWHDSLSAGLTHTSVPSGLVSYRQALVRTQDCHEIKQRDCSSLADRIPAHRGVL